MNADLPPIIGESRAIREAVALARKVAPTTLPVLLVAPTGCGKELFAQWIHRWSGRPGDVLPINCAALPEHLLESELFGHDGQAFTGARHPKPGLIESADGRTCLLDEVTSLPFHLQPKLLRVVETGEVWRVGETRPRRIEVRFVAAAQEDLDDRVATGRFRQDVFQRLAGVVLRIPSLVERPADIVPLARRFAVLAGRTLEPGAESVLVGYPWPGNVRELRLAIERAGCLVDNGTLPPGALRDAIALGAAVANRVQSPAASRRNPVAWRAAPTLSRTAIAAACAASGWNAGRAAAALGVHRATLFRRLRALGVTFRSLQEAEAVAASHSVARES